MNIQTSQLDFASIKTSIIEYFKSQSEFSDYNYEGSGLSILIDALAYNTHYNALYTNMAVNEAFLDSASIRDSVVSLAKGLGYTPRSSTCATAVVDVTVNSPSSNPSSLALAAKTPFTTNIDGVSYTFYSIDEAITTLAEGYKFSNLKLIEGEPLQFTYSASNTVKYVLPNTGVDTTTIKVRVQDNSSSITFTNIVSMAEVSSDSKVFYLKENQGGLYEIYFGGGVVGAQPSNGSKVVIDYFVSSGSLVNSAKVFAYSGPNLIGGTITTATVSEASGGAEPESIEQIRQNAPRFRAAQGRAVTPEDYKAVILDQVAEAASVTVFGGEDITPPVYGKVYISIKPQGATKLTEARKASIISDILKKKNVVSITPEILDPEYILIDLTVDALYNPRLTVRGANEIGNIIRDAILTYDSENLGVFNGVMRHSKLLAAVDSAEKSITNNTISVKLRKQITPRYGINASYIVNLINPIEADPSGSNISSSGFYLSGDTSLYYLEDDGNGKIRLVSFQTNGVKVLGGNVGTVSYTSGFISFSLNLGSIINTDFELMITPYSYDVVSALMQIAQIDNSTMKITVQTDESSTGDLRAGFNYNFASAR